jgi:hypothetical protein
MGDVQHGNDLELGQNRADQQGPVIVQQVSWSVMALIAIAALLGLTGSGWLSEAKVGKSGDPTWIEYERFGRFQAPEKMRIHVEPQQVADGELRIWISRSYLEGMQIHQVTPEPDRMEAMPDRLVYVFKGTAPTAITLYMEPEQIGFLPGSVGLEGGQPLYFQQFVYP